MVERPTQRAIMLGKGGARINDIGARVGLAEHWAPMHLYLRVWVHLGWDDERGVYRALGLDWVD